MGRLQDTVGVYGEAEGAVVGLPVILTRTTFSHQPQ